MYYLRPEKDGKISFVVDGIHEIEPTDIKITTESYNRFFEEQCKGTCFKMKPEQARAKASRASENNAMDFIEAFRMEPIIDEETSEIESLKKELEEMKRVVAKLKMAIS